MAKITVEKTAISIILVNEPFPKLGRTESTQF
jgi:hypothetical protein